MKTAERAHLPNKLWERVKLPKNYEKAMDVINKHLEFWPKLLVHKIKQRLTKMTQYRIRMRKLQLKVREKVMTMPRKQTQRDLRRLEKAERAAQLERNIENELKERLTKGVYGPYDTIYNVPFNKFDALLKIEKSEVAAEDEEEEEVEREFVEGDDMEEMDDMEDMEDFEGLSDGGADEDDDLDDPVWKKPKGSSSNSKQNAGKRSRKVMTEVEQDEELNTRQRRRA